MERWITLGGMIALGLVAGAGAAMQVGFNKQLAQRMGHPGIAALISFVVGTMALLVFCLAIRVAVPSAETFRGTPLSNFAGGLAGAFFVATMVVLAPRFGAATTSGLIIAGQIVTALILDHFGLLGFAGHPITAARAIGASMLVVGVGLVLKY